MKKKVFLLALLTLGLTQGFVSCSDDDDKELTSEQKEQQAIDQLSVTTQYWNVVGQLAGSDSYTEDYQGKTFAPIIGEATNSNEAVRTIITGDLETAAARFCGLVGISSEGFDANKEYVWTNENVGTLTYKPTGGTSLATVDVDIKQMPGLSQLVYKTSDQAGNNSEFTGTAYYRFGDIVKKVENGHTDYWICVRPAFGPEGKEDSHWISVSPLHDSYIKEVTKGGVKHRLPVNLYTNKEHMQNFAELLYAMFRPADYDANLAKNYKKLKYFTDFDYVKHYELNSSGFFADQYDNWGLSSNLQGVPNMCKVAMCAYSGDITNALVKGYGISFIYDVSLKNDAVSMKRKTFYGDNLKTVMDDSFTLSLNGDAFNIGDYSTEKSATIKAPIKFPNGVSTDVKCFFVRYKTGKELCKGTQEAAKYDKRARLTNCEDVVVYNQKMGLDVNDLRTLEPQKAGRVHRPHYRLGDVYQDEKGNKWFVVNMSGHTIERSEYAEFISFDGLEADINKGFVENLPTRAQAVRAYTHLWNIFNAVINVAGDDFGNPSGRPACYLNIREYAHVDIRKLFQRTKAYSNDPRQSSQSACVAYYDEANNNFDITQHLLRVIVNNQNEANDMTFWVWDSYPQNPSALEQFQRSFTSQPILLQDVANQAMVDTYGEDHYARQPLVYPSLEGPFGTVGAERQPRTQADPMANDVTNYYYDQATWNAFQNHTSMWNEPVLFLRMTAARDFGDTNYSTKTVDGHTLTLLHARDWEMYDEDNLGDLMDGLSVYYKTFANSYNESGVKSVWPTWRIWRTVDPDFKM